MVHLIVQIALIIIIVRCVYVAFTHFQRHRKKWLEILFYLSVAIIALEMLF
jgi:hypothetical protein